MSGHISLCLAGGVGRGGRFCPVCQAAFFIVFIVFLLLVRFTTTCFLVACFLVAVAAFGVAATVVVWADAADAPAPPREQRSVRLR